jgi:hypothetical protein
LEARSSSESNKNRIYDISNTLTEDFLMGRSVSTIGSFQLTSSSQSTKFQELIREQVQAQTT